MSITLQASTYLFFLMLRCRAFTLVEVAIVLIVVGLVIGSVTVGRDLVRAAEIRRTITQFDMMNVAVTTFKAKYQCLPGDCTSASSMGFDPSPNAMFIVENQERDAPWFAKLGLVSEAVADPIPTIGNPNGNGDETIGSYVEYYNAVFILEQANLVSGMNQSSYQIPLSLNAKSSAGVQGNLAVMYLTPHSESSINKARHYLWTTATVYEFETGAAVLAPNDASSIDSKIDDGLPRSGKILATGRDDLNPAGTNLSPMFDPSSDIGTHGAAGDFCVTNLLAPQYNVLNTSRAAGSLCSITIGADF